MKGNTMIGRKHIKGSLKRQARKALLKEREVFFQKRNAVKRLRALLRDKKLIGQIAKSVCQELKKENSLFSNTINFTIKVRFTNQNVLGVTRPCDRNNSIMITSKLIRSFIVANTWNGTWKTIEIIAHEMCHQLDSKLLDEDLVCKNVEYSDLPYEIRANRIAMKVARKIMNERN